MTNNPNTGKVADLIQERDDLKQTIYGLRFTLKAIDAALNDGRFIDAVEMLQTTLNKLWDGDYDGRH